MNVKVIFYIKNKKNIVKNSVILRPKIIKNVPVARSKEDVDPDERLVELISR